MSERLVPSDNIERAAARASQSAIPEGHKAQESAGQPATPDERVAPAFITPAAAKSARLDLKRRVEASRPAVDGPPRPNQPRFILVTVVSTFRSLAMTFAAAVIVATVFMWWSSPDFLPAQARRGLAPVQATARQVIVAPTALPTPIWFNRIGILAGHSGNVNMGVADPGAVCPDGFTELQVTTTVADQVVAMLRGRGFTVDLLEEFDERLAGYQAAAFVSLHADSCENYGYGGFKATYPALRLMIRDQDLRLDECIRSNYAAITGMEFRPDSITDNMRQYHAFQRIGQTTPANILELGFLSYDRDLLQNQPERLALGIVNGIMCFLNPVELATMRAPAPTSDVPVPAPTAAPTDPDALPTPTLGLP